MIKAFASSIVLAIMSLGSDAYSINGHMIGKLIFQLWGLVSYLFDLLVTIVLSHP